MYWGILDDGRQVVVMSGGIRMVGEKEFFILPSHTQVILDGGFQIVRKDRLKPAQYGTPFEALRR